MFIGQVLGNTLDNAAKYAGPTAPIAISASLIGDGRVRVTIEDGGIPGSRPRLCPGYSRSSTACPARARVRDVAPGIGLSVVLGLVEAMGGSVAARASALGGLAVDIDLPVATDRAMS